MTSEFDNDLLYVAALTEILSPIVRLVQYERVFAGFIVSVLKERGVFPRANEGLSKGPLSSNSEWVFYPKGN